MHAQKHKYVRLHKKCWYFQFKTFLFCTLISLDMSDYRNFYTSKKKKKKSDQRSKLLGNKKCWFFRCCSCCYCRLMSIVEFNGGDNEFSI